MRTQLRIFFGCRNSLAPIVSYFRHPNRAKLLDSPEKSCNIDYLADAQFSNP